MASGNSHIHVRSTGNFSLTVGVSLCATGCLSSLDSSCGPVNSWRVMLIHPFLLGWMDKWVDRWKDSNSRSQSVARGQSREPKRPYKGADRQVKPLLERRVGNTANKLRDGNSIVIIVQ